MNRFKKNILLFCCLVASTATFAQSTTSSPYSQFGLGILNGPSLPQNRALGGVSAGLRRPGTYSNINLGNPASYSAIELTTFDIGLYSGLANLSKGNVSENNFNASLSHVVFAVPISRQSALSFGLVPYSSLGYRSRVRTELDTNTVDYIYRGEGGLSKAYLGYGIQIGKHLSIGANASYIFGKLENDQDTEFPEDFSFVNSRTQRSNSIGGLNSDLGVQYFTNISKNVKLTLGYTTTLSTNLKSTERTVSTRYTTDAQGNESVALDTSFFDERATMKLRLPSMHTVGFALERSNKWFFGVDAYMGNWKDYAIGGVNQGLQNSSGIAVGWQITPDVNSVSNYFALVDYRLGFRYDKTYINIANQDINQAALTLGFGFPLPSNRTTFYKINFAAELGNRGTLEQNLVRERFVNFHLGFTINDRWFQRYKFD
ncbi:hypothetical protein [Pedobacter sp. SYSU D00535]|uniref:hypothetical protein n=1 Tax=Pedobacter sp. SYSU D00535 TaxID=2810308 RepID=UPI001A95863D|nr:hypothetical protein [Pedobacter sp. SYSU D00535]